MSLEYQVIGITLSRVAGRVDCLAVLFVEDVTITRDLYPANVAGDDRAF